MPPNNNLPNNNTAGNVITPGSISSPMPTPPPTIINQSGQADRPVGVAGMPQPQSVETRTPTPKSGFRRFANKKIILPIIVLLVLWGGSAVAYFGYVVPNKPENVLAKAIGNSLNEHQFTTKGQLDMDSDSINAKLEYSVAVDEDAHATDSKLNLTVSGVSFPIEVISSSNNAYFKVGDLSTVYSLINQFAGAAGQDQNLKNLESQLNSKLKNQWYTVDSTLLKEAKLQCLANYPAAFSQADINSLKKTYQQNPFATITSHSADVVNGINATKYDVSIEDDVLAKTDLGKSTYFSGLQNCIKQADKSSNLSLDSLKDGDKTPISLWVDKNTKRIIKYSSHSTTQDKAKGTTGTLTGTIDYSAVSITRPSGSKPVLNLLDSLDLQDLFGGTVPTTAVPQKPATILQ